jgi:hypothetical protein
MLTKWNWPPLGLLFFNQHWRTDQMKKLAPAALVIIGALSLTACTTTQKTVTGAAVGGAAGAAVGGAVGGYGGAIVGGAAGAAGGAAIANSN